MTALAKPFQTLFAHHQLAWQLLLRDLQATVRGSALGIAWVIVTPLILVAIYTFVFGVVLKSTWFAKTGSPFEVPLIYFLGLATFAFFMEVVTRSPEFIRTNKTYVTKIVFPVDILAWVLVGTAGMKLLASMTLLTIALTLVMGLPPAGLLLLPLVYLPLAVMAVGIAWFLSAIGTYLRDLNQLLIAVAPVLMFVSPLFYSIEQVPENLRFLFWINPLTWVLETARGLIFFGKGIDWTGYGLYWVCALALFFAGYLFFQRARRGFADVI